jgi:hypothetical protein
MHSFCRLAASRRLLLPGRFASCGEPCRPERRVAAGVAWVERGRMGVDPEVPRGVAGDHPAFDIPEHPSRDAAKHGTDGAGRLKSAGVGEIDLSDLPVHDIAATRTETAKRQTSGVAGIHARIYLLTLTAQACVSPSSAMKHGSCFIGDTPRESGGIQSDTRIRKASHRVLSVF